MQIQDGGVASRASVEERSGESPFQWRSTSGRTKYAPFTVGVLCVAIMHFLNAWPAHPLVVAAKPPESVLLSPGTIAPDFSFDNSKGGHTTLSEELQGGDVSIVFVTEKCPYCKRLVRFLEQGEAGNTIRTIVVAGGIGAWPSFESDVSIVLAIDSTGGAFRDYKVSGVPAALRVNSSGHIVANAEGLGGVRDLLTSEHIALLSETAQECGTPECETKPTEGVSNAELWTE